MNNTKDATKVISKTTTRIYADGSEEIKQVFFNENKEYIVRNQDRNTAQKRYRRAKDRLLAFESRFFVTLTVPYESPLRYDSRQLLKLAEKFFKSEGVSFTGVLEAYPNEMGFHIHALVDKKVNLIKWKIMTNAILKDCYCKPIRDRLASANYILKNISKLPKNIRHCITNLLTRSSSYQVNLDNKIVFQNKKAKLNQTSQTNYFQIKYDELEFNLTVTNPHNTLASANIIIKDFYNLYFKCTNIKKQEQYLESLKQNKIAYSAILPLNTLYYSETELSTVTLNSLNLDNLKNEKLTLKTLNQLFKQTFKLYSDNICITKPKRIRLSFTFHTSDLNFIKPP